MTQHLDPCLAAPFAPAPLQEWLLHAMARAEHAGKSPSCIPAMRSGFAELDPLLTGQRLVAVVGPPAVGKTALALRIAHETSRGAHVLYATTMSESTALTTRLLSAAARLPLDDVRRGHLSRDQWARLGAAAEGLGSTPLWLADTPSLSLAELRAAATRQRVEHGLDLLVIDALRPWRHQIWPYLEELALHLSCSVLAVCDAGDAWPGECEQPEMPSDVPSLVLVDDPEQPPLATEERWIRVRFAARGAATADVRARVVRASAAIEPAGPD